MPRLKGVGAPGMSGAVAGADFLAGAEEAAKSGRVPLMVVTGFLGSGKTTLVRRLLELAGGAGVKVAALVNEVAELDVDGALLAGAPGAPGSAALRLANGCVCCTAREELGAAVLRLLSEERPDYLVLETSGVTDPGPLMSSALRGSLARHVALDSVVTLVDAAAVQEDWGRSRAMRRQVAAADVVMLNKADLAGARGLERARGFVTGLHPGARTFPCIRGRVPLSLVMGAGSRRQFRGERGLAGAPPGELRAEPGIEATAEAGGHLEEDGVVTASFRTGRPLRLGAFQRFLQALPPDVLRVKGFVRFCDLPGRAFTLQMCGRRYECTAGDAGGSLSAAGDGAALVLIGPGIDRDGLLEALGKCCQTDPRPGHTDQGSEGSGGAVRPGQTNTGEPGGAPFMERVRRDQRLEPLEPSCPQHVAFTLSGNFQPLGVLTPGLHSATVAHLQGELALAGAFMLPVLAADGRHGLTCALGGGGLSSEELWSRLARALVCSLSRALEDAEQIAQGVDPDLEERDLALLHRFNAMQALMYST